jgi:hypothetical protein
MCQSVETALEVIKTQHKRTLTKGEIVVLFQQVVSDLSKQGEKMNNLEKELSALKEETRNGFDEVNQRLHDVMEAIRNKPKTFWDRIPLLKDIPTWFWIILWTVVIIIGALLGVSPDFIQYIKTGG